MAVLTLKKIEDLEKLKKNLNLSIVINQAQNNETSLKKRKHKPHSRLEQNLLRACIEYLNLQGCFVFRNNTGAVVLEDGNKKRIIKFGSKGSPDIIGCTPDGTFLAVECKSPKGKLSNHQKEFLKEIEKRGGIVFVVKSIDELITKYQQLCQSQGQK